MKKVTGLRLILKELLYKGIVKTQKEFGDRLGYGPSYTSRIISGSEKYPEDLGNKISETYKVSLSDYEALAKSQNTEGAHGGQMYSLPEESDADTVEEAPNKLTGSEISAQKAFAPTENKGIRAVPIRAQANYKHHFMDQVFERQLDRFYIPGFPFDGDNFLAWQMEGDSMTYIKDQREDGILDREWVVVERIPQEYWRQIRDYYVYLVITDTLATLKRIYRLNEYEWVMIPDNPEEEQELLDIEDLRQLWVFKRKLEWNAAPPRRIEITVKSKRNPEE
jgi:transcriptional regulator with XRE-family HTH domain